MKTCKKCSQKKNLDNFYIQTGKADGYANICKVCVRKYSRAYSKSPKGRARDRKRQRTKERRKWNANYRREWRRKNKLKHWCRNKFLGAVLSGKITRQRRCSVCGSGVGMEAHHENYNKPYNVIWLCRKCHKKLHKKLLTSATVLLVNKLQ